MQTFLPYSDFFMSASVLDRSRLGKQRVETLQIMQCLAGERTGWVNHPAVKMWAGAEFSLMQYQEEICAEWTGRGYKDTCLDKTREIYISHFSDDLASIPFWLGDDRLHSSHRSNLLRKDSDWYGRFGWTENPDEPYWWPTSV